MLRFLLSCLGVCFGVWSGACYCHRILAGDSIASFQCDVFLCRLWPPLPLTARCLGNVSGSQISALAPVQFWRSYVWLSLTRLKAVGAWRKKLCDCSGPCCSTGNCISTFQRPLLQRERPTSLRNWAMDAIIQTNPSHLDEECLGSRRAAAAPCSWPGGTWFPWRAALCLLLSLGRVIQPKSALCFTCIRPNSSCAFIRFFSRTNWLGHRKATGEKNATRETYGLKRGLGCCLVALFFRQVSESTQCHAAHCVLPMLVTRCVTECFAIHLAHVNPLPACTLFWRPNVA